MSALYPAVTFGKKSYTSKDVIKQKGHAKKGFPIYTQTVNQGFLNICNPEGVFQKISGISSDVAVPDDTVLRSRAF